MTFRATRLPIETPTGIEGAITPVFGRDQVMGELHRFLRIEGIEGLMAYSDCSERGPFTWLPNLSTASEDTPLHGRCFGALDAESAQ